MIGRWIDRIALTALGAAGFYLFYLNAGFGVPLSVATAFASTTLAVYLYRFRPWRNRVTSAQARGALTAIAMLPEDGCLRALQGLTGRTDILPVVKHPEAALSAGEVFALWRAHMGDAQLVLAATCPAEPEALALAETLAGPKCEIIDSAALLRAIRQKGWSVPENPPRVSLRRRLQRAWARLERPLPTKALPYGLSLWGMYLLTGKTLCLLCALLLIGAAGLGLIRRFA